MSKASGWARSNRPQRPVPIIKADSPAPPVVSARWLASAIGLVIAAAAVCVWGALCLMFWQGSWQLLYHPSSALNRTPAAVGLNFESVEFGVDQSGQAQLYGWWIPGPGPYTAIYLHGADGNLRNAVESLNLLHDAGLSVFALDYRGYGKSHFIHPSETSWREDTETAIRYLIGTRHLPAASLILVGQSLGADLALEAASVHPEIAGVALDQPIDNPVRIIFNDPRARLVPARLLVRDRWDISAAAATLRIPSLWFCRPATSTGVQTESCAAYERIGARKSRVWLARPPEGITQNSPDAKAYGADLARWMDDLRGNR